MFKRVLAIATLALALAGCVPAGGIPGAGFLGTFGQPAGDHPSQVDAVITRVEAGAGAAQAAGCSAAPTGVCGGCTAVCPAGQPARCATGVTRYAAPGSGRASTCVREAVCACG
ncbi:MULTISPECIES: hypothetical protein [unclassified Brevundimonas]|uniref:hypothetical protein n=1 Tax=unclassified Brevundimonas TaxID=2622653 RepID=UPI00070037F7|nr:MULTISPECIES: hypothetical protein [unclassified Brevundimonas]KQY88077.1 hypothetical protein ASD25_21160 [Brevundimonas sp. Root1423]KRA28625.1 hypothetical protein ASD59_02010 [Brevundimonas sp. Root608]